jgi:hypothetical protein
MPPSSLSRRHSQVVLLSISTYTCLFILYDDDDDWFGNATEFSTNICVLHCVLQIKKLLAEESDKGQARKSNAPKHKVAPPAIPLQGDKKDDVRTASPGIIDDKSTESARYCKLEVFGICII